MNSHSSRTKLRFSYKQTPIFKVEEASYESFITSFYSGGERGCFSVRPQLMIPCSTRGFCLSGGRL